MRRRLIAGLHSGPCTLHLARWPLAQLHRTAGAPPHRVRTCLARLLRALAPGPVCCPAHRVALPSDDGPWRLAPVPLVPGGEDAVYLEAARPHRVTLARYRVSGRALDVHWHLGDRAPSRGPWRVSVRLHRCFRAAQPTTDNPVAVPTRPTARHTRTHMGGGVESACGAKRRKANGRKSIQLRSTLRSGRSRERARGSRSRRSADRYRGIEVNL